MFVFSFSFTHRSIPLLLVLLTLSSLSHQNQNVLLVVQAKVVNPYGGKPFRVEPAAFGSTLSQTETIRAHLQVVDDNPTLCPPQEEEDEDDSTSLRSSTTSSIVEPSDGLPVVLLAKYENGNCFAGEMAKFVDESLEPRGIVKYVLVQGSNTSSLLLLRTMVSEYETDLGILFIHGTAGNILRDYMNTNKNTQGSNEDAGPIIEFDGSLPDDYISFRKKMAIFPKFSAALSMMGSSYIVNSHVGYKKDRVKELHRTFNRIFLLLAISDIFSSFGVFLSTWMIPKSTDEGYMQYVWNIEFPYAAGNDATCSFQGFLIHFGFIASVLLTAFIAIQFVLQVRYRWTEKNMRKAEKFFFVMGVIFPLITAIALASVGAFNPTTNGFCHINTDPYQCYGDDDPLCYQKKESDSDWIWALQTFTATIWIGLALLAVIISMVLLFCTVRSQELRAQRWIAGSADGKRQKMVITKAFYYIGAFLLVWLPTVLRMTDVLPYGKTDLIMNCILPLQGLLNAIIYSNGINKITKKIRNSFSRDNTTSSYLGLFGENLNSRSYLGMIGERSVAFFTFTRKNSGGGSGSGSGGSSDPNNTNEEKSSDGTKKSKNSLDDANRFFQQQQQHPNLGHSDLESYESSIVFDHDDDNDDIDANDDANDDANEKSSSLNMKKITEAKEEITIMDNNNNNDIEATEQTEHRELDQQQQQQQQQQQESPSNNIPLQMEMDDSIISNQQTEGCFDNNINGTSSVRLWSTCQESEVVDA